MKLKMLRISELQTGQIFLCQHGSMYRVLSDCSALLVRFSDGSEPGEETVRVFQNSETVELVPKLVPRKFAA